MDLKNVKRLQLNDLPASDVRTPAAGYTEIFMNKDTGLISIKDANGNVRILEGPSGSTGMSGYYTTTEVDVLLAELSGATDLQSVCETGSVFTDRRGTTLGIQYDEDYSFGFDDRSLVDKGYVDAQKPYKVYTCMMTQTGGTVPYLSSAVLEDSLYPNLYWAIDGENASLFNIISTNSAFTVGKTVIIMGETRDVVCKKIFSMSSTTISISIQTHDLSNEPNLMTNMLFEIRVYN